MLHLQLPWNCSVFSAWMSLTMLLNKCTSLHKECRITELLQTMYPNFIHQHGLFQECSSFFINSAFDALYYTLYYITLCYIILKYIADVVIVLIPVSACFIFAPNQATTLLCTNSRNCAVAFHQGLKVTPSQIHTQSPVGPNRCFVT